MDDNLLKYTVKKMTKAEEHYEAYKKAGNKKAIEKIDTFIKELEIHPKTGTGHPEPLANDPLQRWSRRIDKKNRMEYTIEEDIVTVFVISAMGHYGDK
jgi:toxin YoeB